MSESLSMWVEIIFNISYLIFIWALVIAMVIQRHSVEPQDRSVAQRIRWMFALLAFGDTGHLSVRVLAFAMGGIEANPLLVGLGSLATAITVTFFYMLAVDVWHLHFEKPINWFGWMLLATGIVRLITMALPGNEWGSNVPPQPMFLYRNILLIIQGLGVMYLILRDAFTLHDRTFQWIGAMVGISYFFYLPVILFSQKLPILGLLMIPKTLAYIAIALISYRTLYKISVTKIPLKATN